MSSTTPLVTAKRMRPYRNTPEYCDKLAAFCMWKWLVSGSERHSYQWFTAVERARKLASATQLRELPPR